MTKIDDKMIDALIELAMRAGDAIMEVYKSDDFEVTIKNDSHSSPLTRADLASNSILAEGLEELTPDIHIVTEEDDNTHSIDGIDEYWLIDPLDGTKEFIKRNGEFTVNLGLIHNKVPVFGVVYAPDKNILYFGGEEIGAYKVVDGKRTKIYSRTHKTPIIVVSRSHINDETEEYLTKNYPKHELVRSGSSLKICLVADGSADCYPRLAPTMEWDTAAADAILRAAGGTMTNDDELPFLYGKKDLFNLNFICKA